MLIIESSIKPIEIFFHSDLDESQSCKEFLIDSVQSVVKNLIFLDDVNEIFKYFNLNENVKILIIEIDNYKLGVDYTNLLNIQNNIPTLLVVKQDDTESLNFLLSLGFHHFIIKDSNKDNLLSKINVMYIESKNKIELEKTERELSSLNEELEEKISIIENNREKIEDDIKERELFLANISHEIRTPLNAMMGFVELLKDTPLNEDQKSYIDTISYSSKNLTNILNDVLDYSKIESNNLRIENICINIKDELTEVLNLFQIEAQNKNLYLNLEIEENVPLNIKTDPTRVKQIISNLVNNAIKFTVSGGVSILVKTFSNLDGRFIEFAVKDTGIGISSSIQEYIFKEFRQANETISRKFGGTGLGLSISTKIASLLGSSLKLQSKEGIGSKFYFKLKVDECKKDCINESEKEIKFDKNKKVLIAEDIGTNARLMKEIFSRIGLEADVASNGEEAYDMYLENSYNIIFMDINMPIEDGIKTTFKILAYERKNYLENTPIIALTANAMPEDKDNYLMNGMDDYIVKPVSKDRIIDILNIYL